MLKRWTVVLAVAAIAAAGCGKSSKHGQPAGGPGVLSALGGRGSGGPGGAGGSIVVYSETGDVRVVVTPTMGTVPTWSVPDADLGSNPRTVTGIEDITPDEIGVILGDDGELDATALWVKPGATATLLANVVGGIDLELAGPLVVDGTLRLGPQGGDRTGLSGTATELHVGAMGVIDGKGGDASGADGGTGGSFDLTVAGNTLVAGTIDTRGGNGDNGGEGGYVNVVVSSGWVVVTGVSDSSGGMGLAGAGGDAGGNQIWGRWADGGTGNLYNAGQLVARGGDGTTRGGNGNYTYVSSCKTGWAVQSATGVLDSSGGDATVSGDGGSANSPEIESSGDKIWASGAFYATGGKGAGTGIGGWGGPVYVSANSSIATDAVLGGYVAALVDVSGGDGLTGGDGGSMEISTARSSAATPAPLYVAAASLDASGGQGASLGGQGGAIYLSSYGGPDLDVKALRANPGVAVGDLSVDVSAKAEGGGSTAGAAGSGGYIEAFATHVKVVGLSVDGGAAADAAGGDGGTIGLTSGTPPSMVGAPLTTRGGTGAPAGSAGSITIDGSGVALTNGVYTP